MAKKKLFEHKTILSNNTKMYLIKSPDDASWKLHRYGGPAIEPLNKNSTYKKEYYLYGQQYDFETYENLTKQKEDNILTEDQNLEDLRF